MKFQDGYPNLHAKSVMIYRLGSLGDTVVALPCYHLISKAFPNAQITLLSNIPVANKAVSPKSILTGTDYVQKYLSYTTGLASFKSILKLASQIKKTKSDCLIYLLDIRPTYKIIRDLLFLRLAGIKKIIGFSRNYKSRQHKFNHKTQLYENETDRLLRCLKEIGKVPSSQSFPSLNLQTRELQHASNILQRNKISSKQFIACSFGTKMPAKDWGSHNWKTLLEMLRVDFKLPLILFGSPSETDMSTEISTSWPEPVVNLCGKLTPRQSASLMSHAKFFIGLDSGPMHLAAATNIPCVAIFSSRDKKGCWYPKGKRHIFFYNPIECQHCLLEVCPKQNKCIMQTEPAQVYKVCKSTFL